VTTLVNLTKVVNCDIAMQITDAQLDVNRLDHLDIQQKCLSKRRECIRLISISGTNADPKVN